MDTGFVKRKTLLWGLLLVLTTSWRATASPPAVEREAFQKLVAIAESEWRAGATRSDELIQKYFKEFPPDSTPPGFFLCGWDLIITSEDSVRAFGHRSPVPILVVPSLKAIVSAINRGMSYDDALSNLANFPSGNIQELVIETIKTARNPAVRVNAILSLRRVDLSKSTTRYLADQLKGSNSDLRLAALFALQPYALGDDLSGRDDVGFGLPTPMVSQSLRLKRNSYNVEYVLSAAKRSGFEAKAASLLLGVLSAPQFVDSGYSADVARKLQNLRSPTEVENAFMSYCIQKILNSARQVDRQ